MINNFYNWQLCTPEKREERANVDATSNDTAVVEQTLNNSDDYCITELKPYYQPQQIYPQFQNYLDLTQLNAGYPQFPTPPESTAYSVVEDVACSTGNHAASFAADLNYILNDVVHSENDKNMKALSPNPPDTPPADFDTTVQAAIALPGTQFEYNEATDKMLVNLFETQRQRLEQQPFTPDSHCSETTSSPNLPESNVVPRHDQQPPPSSAAVPNNDPMAGMAKMMSVSLGKNSSAEIYLCPDLYALNQKPVGRVTKKLRHEKGLPYQSNIKCPHCGKECGGKGSLNQHIAYHHSDKPLDYKCTICGKKFPTLQKQKRHLLNHTDNARKHLCSECPARYRQKADLNRHMVQKHQAPSDSIWTCRYCDKSQVRRDHHIRHELICAKKRGQTVDS